MKRFMYCRRRAVLLDLFRVNRLDKLLVGCHPGNTVEKISQGSALGAQGAHSSAHRIFAGGTPRHVCICPVECKKSLVELANMIAVFPHKNTAGVPFSFFPLHRSLFPPTERFLAG